MSMSQAMSRFDSLDASDPAKWQIGEQFAQALGQQFLQGHQVVQNRTDGELEMRGSWHGYPVRMKLDMNFGTVEWDMKSQNPTGQTLYLFWDEEAIPNVGQFSGDFQNDWGDSSEESVFFARGAYLKCDSADMAPTLAVYSALPDAVRSALASLMVADKISKIYAYHHGGLWLSFNKNLQELADPLNQVGRGVWLMGQVTWGLSQIQPGVLPQVLQANAQATAPGAAVHKMICRYCTTHFLLEHSSRCPNCGAPPS